MDEKPSTKKTGFTKYFENRMKEPTFMLAYNQARTIIDLTVLINNMIRDLDKLRLLAVDLRNKIESLEEE